MYHASRILARVKTTGIPIPLGILCTYILSNEQVKYLPLQS